MKRDLKEGLKSAWPIWLGYLPIGLVFGVLSQKAGLRPAEIGFMSLIVFAGSSQFIAVSMISASADALSIVATTFVVNLRHFLMSSALSVYLGKRGLGWHALFAYGVTDESFGVNLTRFKRGEGNWRQGLVVNHTANAVWIMSTILGGLGGEYIPAGAFGIDFALSAMFISLLVFQLKGRLEVITGIIAGFAAVGLSLLIPGNTYIVIAAVLSATIGLFIKHRPQIMKEVFGR
ncbi:AzlC family ABC transporter permease [Thermodesulfobacteriota bacterium]